MQLIALAATLCMRRLMHHNDLKPCDISSECNVMFLNLLHRTHNEFSLLGLEQQQYLLVLFWLSLVVSLPLPSRVIFIAVAIAGVLVNCILFDKMTLM
jgi:hypothetical protein